MGRCRTEAGTDWWVHSTHYGAVAHCTLIVAYWGREADSILSSVVWMVVVAEQGDVLMYGQKQGIRCVSVLGLMTMRQTTRQYLDPVCVRNDEFASPGLQAFPERAHVWNDSEMRDAVCGFSIPYVWTQEDLY